MADPEDRLAAIKVRFRARMKADRDRLLLLSENPAERHAIQDLAHKLAGLAGSLGFERVSDRAAALDRLLCSPALDASRHLAALITEIDQAVDGGTGA